MSKTHLLSYDPELTGPAICGTYTRNQAPTMTVRVTDDVLRVTCKICLRKMRDMRSRGAVRVSWEEAIADLAHLLAGPRVEPYPEMTPDLWRSMRCRQGHQRCGCDFCRADEANVAIKRKWSEDQLVRPHRRYEHPFGSVSAALEMLLRWKVDGVGARSSQGSIQARCIESARLGTDVQTTRRADRDTLELRRATYAVDLEAAVRRVYRDPQVRGPVGEEEAFRILLSSVSDAEHVVERWAEALEVSEAAVTGVIRRGRRGLAFELARLGYTPEPRGVRQGAA